MAATGILRGESMAPQTSSAREVDALMYVRAPATKNQALDHELVKSCRIVSESATEPEIHRVKCRFAALPIRGKAAPGPTGWCNTYLVSLSGTQRRWDWPRYA